MQSSFVTFVAVCRMSHRDCLAEPLHISLRPFPIRAATSQADSSQTSISTSPTARSPTSSPSSTLAFLQPPTHSRRPHDTSSDRTPISAYAALKRGYRSRRGNLVKVATTASQESTRTGGSRKLLSSITGGSSRSASPAKRTISEMEVPNETDGDVEDVDMAAASSPVAEGATSQEPANKKQTRSTQLSSLSREESVDMLSENESYTFSHAANRSPQSGSSNTSTTPASGVSDGAISQPANAVPSLERQVAIIRDLAQVPLHEDMPAYVISNQWLKDAQERAEGSKKESDGPLQPLDVREFLAPKYDDEDLQNELGEDFWPLKPGLTIGQEIEILPSEAFNKIQEWYGSNEDSPMVRRFCHNTSNSPGSENLAYEMYPPIFTIMSLPGNDSGLDSESLEERQKRAPRVVASRTSSYEALLDKMNRAAGVGQNEDVRVWRVLSSVMDAQHPGMMTPAHSRSNSPAPTSFEADLGDKLVLDATKFLSLQEGSQRELVEAPETANKPTTGNVTVEAAGLGQEGILILEQRIGGPAGGEWASDFAASKASRLGFKLKPKSALSSGRNSPAPGMQTRGRTQKMGRARGTMGLGNLGNTCYMNSALQCVRSVKELTAYFLEDKYTPELNEDNPLGHQGNVARAYAGLIKQLYSPSGTSFSPRVFKQVIGRYGPSFSGYGQQDSQEFLLFLLDGLQEDLNRIYKKPYIEKPDSTDEMVHDDQALQRFADRCWEIYKARNDSVITDLFAGMYKSTVKCPVCDKVSIIFDPFNNLTLQLPIENAFARNITFYPLNLTPIEIDVDIDKNATFAQLKEYIGKKVDVNPKRLVLAEIYRSRFFKMFDDRVSISEDRIQVTDLICCFELDDIPSDYPPPQSQMRSYNMLNFYNNTNDDEDDETLDLGSNDTFKMLVPVFHRVPREKAHSPRSEMQSFGEPAYIVLSLEDAKDPEIIMKKILARVATMTTKDILEQGNDSEGQGSDTVLLNGDDADWADSTADSKVQAQSVQSEEGIVDISMKDGDEESMTPRISYPPPPRLKKPLPAALHPDASLSWAFNNLFELKYCDDSGTSSVTTGWNAIVDGKNLPLLTSRIPKSGNAQKPTPNSIGAKLKRRIANGGSGSESSDEDLDNVPPPAQPTSIDSSVSSDEDEQLPVQPLQAPNEDLSAEAEPQDVRLTSPLVRPGEGIVCDWNPEAYDSLFSEGSDADDSEFRGAPTWDRQKPQLPDPEVDRRRQIRNARKRDGVTLSDCLEEFGKEEILSENDAWYCPRCKEHRRASKKFELWKAPDILVIHLKRFSAQGRLRDKLDVKVDFPTEGLDLSSRVAVHNDGDGLIYDLFAVDNHYGGLGGGHYTAFAQNFNDGQWWEYNDSIASREGNPQAVVTRAAYLLFYRRRSEKHLGGPFFEKLFSEDTGNETESASSPQSRTQSPSQTAGEGQHLDDFSRSGSSSVYPAAGAVHQAGGGGRQVAKNMIGPMISLDDELPSYSDDPGSDRPILNLDPGAPAHQQSAVVTWEGFGNLNAHGDDNHSTGQASSTGAIHEDGDSVRSAGSNGFAPGTPADNDAPMANEQAPPEINISAASMEDAPDTDLDDHPVAEVRLESDDGKAKAD